MDNVIKVVTHLEAVDFAGITAIVFALAFVLKFAH